jgi:hypothetical protein
MKQINIRRENDTVKFDPAFIDETETVVFTNLDPKEAHWPDLSWDRVGPFQSDNSSECPVDWKKFATQPPPGAPPPEGVKVTYKCKLHSGEQGGTIQVYALLAPATIDVNNPFPIRLRAKVGSGTQQQLVKGGKSPYTISMRGSPGPGLGVVGTLNNDGVWVRGTPSRAGIYSFTFNVDDGMEGNLQQVDCEITVAP